MSELVLSERHGNSIILTLNRPKVLNALNREVVSSLGEHVADVAKDSSVRALVITGAGRAFAAGADLSEMKRLTPLEAIAFSQFGHGVLGALETLNVPTIAAVHGFALGGGCEVACACDWIYASQEARFGQPEVNLGLIPGFGGTSRLVRRVGIGWGKEIICSGESIDAETALRIGLVNRIFDSRDTLLEGALEVADKIAKNGPVAVGLGKVLVQATQSADLDAAHTAEQAMFGTIFGTEDHLEGMDAFLTKRSPKFRGR